MHLNRFRATPSSQHDDDDHYLSERRDEASHNCLVMLRHSIMLAEVLKRYMQIMMYSNTVKAKRESSPCLKHQINQTPAIIPKRQTLFLQRQSQSYLMSKPKPWVSLFIS